MKKLTPRQIELLPTVQDIYKNKKDKKSQVMVSLIQDYLEKKEQTKTELDTIKIAVQIYQIEQKNEKIRKKEKEIDHLKNKKASKDLTREKIILGACTHYLVKQAKGTPFLDFLRAWADGFVSERDLDFMRTRHKLHHAYFSGSGNPYWAVYKQNTRYLIYRDENKQDEPMQYCYQIYVYDQNNSSWHKTYGVWVL